ncbi:bifunctional pyr operon transcriptional regulator/uracil phosphoribosyltransferase PyrR [candidate division WOR-3 bacterium]|nr:bifunctional pyr operon transcriptional regulator/uracil phosphoribosyltransferase PyrR [candidate division WOR-3 bacterium]
MNIQFKDKRILLDKMEMQRTIERLSSEIIKDNPDIEVLCIMGIRKRGDILAKRLANILKKTTSWEIEVGVLDITLYRDDLTIYGPKPIIGSTYFPSSIDGKEVLLVDDVIYTGRTIRSALDEIMDYGRPLRIKLAVLVNRGGRELPILPDYTGISVELGEKEEIQVLLKETDKEDMVKVVEVKNGIR